MRKTAIGSAVLLGLLLSSASSQTPPKAEGKPAPDLKRSDLFGPDKLWTIHLKLGAKEYAAMPPKGARLGFPNPKKDDPPKTDANKDAEAPNTHKNKALGTEFLCTKRHLGLDATSLMHVGPPYTGNATS